MSKRELQREFNVFFDFFKDAVLKIEKLYIRNPGFCDEAIILLCAYIDALAVFRFGGGKNGFIKFIENYSNAQIKSYYTKVSALFLDQSLLDEHGKIADGMDKEKIKRIRKKLYGNNKNYDSLVEVDKYSAISKLRRFKYSTKYIERFSYARYFYHKYRCFGVHNVQPPGYNNSEDVNPFYISTNDLNAGIIKWDLVLPIKFILNTLRSCIDNCNAPR